MSHLRCPLVLLAAGLFAAAGCSQDRHVFRSTVDLPTSVAVVDAMRDATLWQMDVPVQHKLVLDFDHRPELEPIITNTRPATRLAWRMYADGKVMPVKSDRLRLPGTPILVTVSYRPSPELPPEPEADAEAETAEPMIMDAEPAQEAGDLHMDEQADDKEPDEPEPALEVQEAQVDEDQPATGEKEPSELDDDEAQLLD